MKKNLFTIDNFNVISDEEFYYVFRALNSGDHNDINEQKTIENGNNLVKIRTDRERWEEQNGRKSKYAESTEPSVEEIISHCKAFEHSKETNCISLTSNANIVLNYGEGYNDEYVLVKIPKKSSEGFIEAGRFLLEDLERRINEIISKLDTNSELYQRLENINSQTQKEIIELVVDTFTKVKSEGKYTGRNVLKDKTSIYSRFESKQIFSEEQQRKFSEIIGKLTLLEMHGKIKPILTNTRDNSLYLKTLGAIFSNTEILHYNSLESKDFIPISRTLVDLFALIQQVGDKDRTNDQIKDIERKVLQLAQNGYDIKEEDGKLVLTNGKENIDIPQVDIKILSGNNFNDTQTDIDYIYRLTGGKIPYEKAKEYIEFSCKLGQSRQKAQEFSKILSAIFNNDNLEEVINKIAKEGFAINKDIIRRQDGKGIQISESVNIDGNKGLKNTLNQQEQEKIVEFIRSLSPQELEQFMQQDAVFNNKLIETLISSDEGKTENEYYAEAILDSLDIAKIYSKNTSRDKSLKEDERQRILAMIENANCKKIYNAFLNAGVSREDVSAYIINILANGGYKGFLFEELSNLDDLEEIIKINVQNKNLKGHVYPSTMESLRGIIDNDNKVEDTLINLRDYQQETIENVDRIFADGKRFAGVVLPTGAGKSFVAMTEMLKKQNGNILYIAPQQEILSQIQRHILKNIAKVDVLTTDEIETLKKEQNVAKSNQLKLPSGKILPTQANEYVKKVFPHLKLLCYQGLASKGDSELTEDEKNERDTEEKELREVLKNADADLIVFDELHRSGAKTWKNVVEQLINTNSHADILGITATPIRDADHVDMMRELATMTNTYTEEELNTKQYLGYEMYLTDAIQRGLVVEPKLVSFDFMLRDTDEYQEILEMIATEEDEAKKKDLIEIKKQIDNLISGDTEITEHIKNNISQKENEMIGRIIKDTIQKKDGRYIVFLPQHSGSDGLDENEYFKQQEQKIREILKEIDEEPEISRLSSKDSKAENHRAITDFENSTSKHLKIMLAINKLNEGVHINGINGEIMYRKINDGSTILYLQQLGRVIYSLDPNNPIPEDEIPIVYDIYNNYLVQDLNRTVNQTTPKSDLQKLQEIIDWMDKHDYESLDINSEDINEARKAITLKKIQNKYKKYREGINNPRLSKSDIYEIEQILDLANSIDLFNKDLGERIISPGERELSQVQLFKVTATQKNFLELYKKANKIRGTAERHTNRPAAKLNDIMNILATLNSNDIFIDNNLIQYGDTLSDVILKCPEEFRQILLEELYMYEEDYPIGREYNFAKSSFRDSSVWKYFENSDVRRLYECGIFENIDENYINEIEEDSNKKEALRKEVLSNDFVVLGPKNLKGINVKTGTYYDENGYDIKGYNANSITKDFATIEIAKILLQKQIISEDTLIDKDTTIEDLLKQAGYTEESAIKKICSELGINANEKIGQSIEFLRTAYETSARSIENSRMFSLFKDDLYLLALLGIIPNDKITESCVVKIGEFKGRRIPNYSTIYYKKQEEERKRQKEERRKRYPFDAIDTGIKLLHKGIIKSGKDISLEDTVEDILRKHGYTEIDDIEEICKEIGLDKNEKFGEKLQLLMTIYNSGKVRKDNDDGKSFWEYSDNMFEMAQLGILTVNETGKIDSGTFYGEYIEEVKQENERRRQEERKRQEEDRKREKEEREERDRKYRLEYKAKENQFRGIDTAIKLLKNGLLFEGETIDKGATVGDILLLHNCKEEQIKEICSKLNIDINEKLGEKIALLKKEYLNPTEIGKEIFKKEQYSTKTPELVQLGIIPLSCIDYWATVKEGTLSGERDFRVKDIVSRLEYIEVLIFNSEEREKLRREINQIKTILEEMKKNGQTSKNSEEYKNLLIQGNQKVRLYMTANREQKKLSTIDKTEEFEQRKERSKIYLYKIQNERLREEERKRREEEIRKIDETRKQQLEAKKKKEEENKKNSPEEIAKKEKQTEMFLNLKEKARKLASGEMKIEEYIQTSTTSIDELITFAKKQKMGSDIISALSKLKPQYAVYKQPFKKEEYLSQTTLIIDGEYVKPTEKDVDLCIAYLKSINSWICYKTVSETVRKFLRGELDITLKTEELQEKIKGNKAIIAENEAEIKENLVDIILAQQSKIQSQEAEKTELKSQRRDIDE